MSPKNPFLFFVQVSTRRSYCLFRSNNVCLILLPCPEECCYLAFSAVSIIESCSVYLTLLLVLFGDVVLNPGPCNTPQDNVEALFTKLPEGRTTILAKLSQMEEKLHQIEQRQSEAEARMRELNSKLETIEQSVRGVDALTSEVQT